jgi:RHS repeat-associated protein
VVSGATFFDPLGRPYRQYNPTRGTTALGTFDPNSPLPDTRYTDTMFDLWDLPNTVTEPGNRVTTIAYEYGKIDNAGPTLYQTTETAPNGRKTVTFTDFRDVVRASVDAPVGAVSQRTLYQSDGMGQLLKVTDPTGFVTTHTYDRMGRRTSTNTPDGGLVTFGYDADGQLISKATPNLRAKSQQIGYEYALHRLTRIDYPGAADDVTYTYGGMGAADNGAGQVVRSEDGSRIQANVYDPAGNIVRQATTMKLHNWTPTGDQSKFTWTTQWQHDGLGRLKSMVYPDSERLTYGYDAGGLVNFISGDEDGYKTVVVGTDPLGQPIYGQVPWTWHYEYLRDRQYDEFLRRRYDVDGNGVTTALTFDPNTQWLSHQVSVSPNRNLGGQPSAFQEIQDLSYTYDSVGNPLTYRNDIPGPTPSLFSGPAKESYTYDAYERIVAAKGDWQQSTGKLRQYDLKLTYDTRGNVTSKTQKDWIVDGKKELIQTDTTYAFTRTYSQPAPHQPTADTNGRYTYDSNGNLTGILDAKGKFIRAITWDAADRMRSVSDGPSTTDYTYDDSGQRAIERGPAGETATINPWATVRNANEIFKHIWAGNDRIGTQRDDGGVQEVKQYFLHKDLQGSTNIVTDITGNTFQHHEYFATGEVWVDEKSTVFRTPYQFGGGYVDEVRKITNFGARWYDQNRELFYSPDPVLVDDPMAIVGTPALRSAYAFAGSNPITYIDPSGRQFTEAQREFKAKLAQNPALREATVDMLKTRLPKSLVRLGLNTESADLHQKRFNTIDDIAKPFVEINISTGEVNVSPGLFIQFTLRKGATSNAAAQATPSNQPAPPTKTVTFAAGTKPGAPSTNTAGPSANSSNGASATAPQAKPQVWKSARPQVNGSI